MAQQHLQKKGPWEHAPSWRSDTPGLVPKQREHSLGLLCFAVVTLEAVLQGGLREGWPLPSHGCCTYTMALVLGTACPPATAVWHPWWSSWPDWRPASLPWFARQSGLFILSPAVIARPPCPLMPECCGTYKNAPTNPAPQSVWISILPLCVHILSSKTHAVIQKRDPGGHEKGKQATLATGLREEILISQPPCYLER